MSKMPKCKQVYPSDCLTEWATTEKASNVNVFSIEAFVVTQRKFYNRFLDDITTKKSLETEWLSEWLS